MAFVDTATFFAGPRTSVNASLGQYGVALWA